MMFSCENLSGNLKLKLPSSEYRSVRQFAGGDSSSWLTVSFSRKITATAAEWGGGLEVVMEALGLLLQYHKCTATEWVRISPDATVMAS